MDNIVKRIFHAFFGILAGGGLGVYLGLPEHFLLGAIIGAVVGGTAAFFLLDEFWKAIVDLF